MDYAFVHPHMEQAYNKRTMVPNIITINILEYLSSRNYMIMNQQALKKLKTNDLPTGHLPQ